MIEQLDISERRACCYAGLSRTSYREPPSMDVASRDLSARIVELPHLRRRFGERRLPYKLSALLCIVRLLIFPNERVVEGRMVAAACR
jgi:hypothetical protein